MARQRPSPQQQVAEQLKAQQELLALTREKIKQATALAAVDKDLEEAEKEYSRKLRAAKGTGGALANLGDELGEAGLPGGKLLGKLQGGLNKLAPGLSAGIDKAMSGLLGGGSAAAALGPIGAVAAGISTLAPVVKKVAEAPFKLVETGFGAVNKALQGLSGTLGPISSMLGAIEGYGSYVKGLGDALGPAGIGLQVMGGAIEGLTKQVDTFLRTTVHLGSAASPGQATRYQRALKDTEAVVGQRLVPLLEAMTDAVRLMGDVLQTVLPSWQEMKTAMAPLGDALKDVRSVITPLAYIIKNELSFALKLASAMFKQVVDMAGAMARRLAGLFGIDLSAFAGLKLQSSIGAAPMAASTSGIDEYAKKVYQGALSGQGNDPAKQTATNTGSMLQALLDLPNKLAAKLAATILGPLQGLGGKLSGGLGNLPIPGLFKGDFSGMTAKLQEGFANLPMPGFLKGDFSAFQRGLAGIKLPSFKMPSFKGIGGGLQKALGTAFDSIPGFFRGDFTAVKSGLKEALEAAIPEPLRALFGGGKGAAESATEAIGGAKSKAEEILEQIRDGLKNLPGGGGGEAPQEESLARKAARYFIIPGGF